jgi:hypothetical protein
MRRICLLALLLGLASCGDAKPAIKLSEALPTLIIPPNSTMLSKEIGEDALKVRLRSDESPDAVAKFYRVLLVKAPWKLVSDAPDANGAVALYAENADGHSMWVTISKAVGASGSVVDIAGVRIPKH